MFYDEINTVYFYCKASTFRNIIINKKLRLSDITKSNDSDEVKLMIGKIEEKVAGFLRKQDFSEDMLAWIRERIHARYEYKLKHTYWLALCTSRNKDRLEMMREYADNCRGFVIGLNVAQLKKYGNHPRFRFGKINYIEKSKSEFVDMRLTALTDKLDAYKSASVDSNNCSAIKEIVDGWIEESYDLVPFYKNDYFAYEEEYRMCYIRTIFEQQFNEMSSNSSLNDISFDVKDDDTVMYIEKVITPKMISEIIICSNNKTSEEEVRLFLAKNSFQNIKSITKSPVTFVAKG